MKYIFYLLLSLSLVGCTKNPYVLLDKNQNKNYLIEYIKGLEKKDKITDKPMIVIDGKVYDFDYLKKNKIPLRRVDIDKIDVLEKNNETAFNIYGEKGKAGILLITTSKLHESTGKVLEGKVLFLIGDKPISQADLQSIDPKDIESIDVFKDKSTIKQYTSGDYDGVVIITLKKNKKHSKINKKQTDG